MHILRSRKDLQMKPPMIVPRRNEIQSVHMQELSRPRTIQLSLMSKIVMIDRVHPLKPYRQTVIIPAALAMHAATFNATTVIE